MLTLCCVIEDTTYNNKKEENKSFFSVKFIFQKHWKGYLKTHNAREVERQEVEKMLSCKGLERGCFLYYCPSCKKDIIVPFGCNSRICSCCGKRYADKWAEMLSKRVAKGIIHRSILDGAASTPICLWITALFMRHFIAVIQIENCKRYVMQAMQFSIILL